MKAYLGQECVVGKYGMGRVTSLEKPGHIGVTPYVARYEMQFADSNVELIQPSISGSAAFKQEMQEMNVMLENKQDIDLVMNLSLNELRKELLITRASLDESGHVQHGLHLTCEQLQNKLKKKDNLMLALKSVFPKEMRGVGMAEESHTHYPPHMSIASASGAN